MTSEDYKKKTDVVKKELNLLRKDINYRDEQEKRGEPNYTIDAEIQGQFIQLNEELKQIEMIVNTYRTNAKDFHLSQSQANKRYKAYEQLNNELVALKRVYDNLFLLKSNPKEASNPERRFDKKYPIENLSARDLQKLKEQQDSEQDSALDELIQNVKGLKKGQKDIHGELSEHSQLLQSLGERTDANIGWMGAARRRMSRLLQSSGYCCLISVIVVEIAVIAAIWVVV